MKTNYKRTLFYALALVATVIGGNYFLTDHGMKKAETTTPARQSSHPAEKKILYWTDPMIPDYKAKGPGKSPMGMDLVPVYDEGVAEGTVKISPKTEQIIGLLAEKIEVRNISKTIRAAGTVTYDERKVANIQSKVSGWVEKLYVNFTGQKVSKGDHLLEIYSPDLVSSEEEFLLAVKNRAVSSKSMDHDMGAMGDGMYEAARKRLQYFDVPEHQITELEQTGKVFKTLHLHSPFDGVLTGKQVFAGMQVSPGMTLYTVADLSTVWVQADVYEQDTGWVKPGDRATITLPAYPGKKFVGRVRYINPFLEKETRTVKVRMEFENPGMELKPEMYANVEINTASHQGVGVPAQAVIRGGRKDIVIISKGGGLFEPREVKIGSEGDKYFEALNGLEAGEMVVTSAQFLIDSESNLREAVNKIKGKE
jgi:multidrug efflux pump subunit AcrA (membrane-fusion protein)